MMCKLLRYKYAVMVTAVRVTIESAAVKAFWSQKKRTF